MNLQKRIQQSASELGKLLRQAEKQHRRFLNLRDRKIMRKHYCPKRLFCEELPKPGDIYPTDGLPIGFSIVVPTNAGRDGLIADLATTRRQAARVRRIAQDIARAVRDQGNPIAIPMDNGKPFKPIGLRRAEATHKLSTELTQQVHKAVDQIDSKLNAVLEIHGTEAVFNNPASKIVFNVEISRIGNKFCNQVHYVIKAD